MEKAKPFYVYAGFVTLFSVYLALSFSLAVLPSRSPLSISDCLPSLSLSFPISVPLAPSVAEETMCDIVCHCAVLC